MFLSSNDLHTRCNPVPGVGLRDTVDTDIEQPCHDAPVELLGEERSRRLLQRGPYDAGAHGHKLFVLLVAVHPVDATVGRAALERRGRNQGLAHDPPVPVDIGDVEHVAAKGTHHFDLVGGCPVRGRASSLGPDRNGGAATGVVDGELGGRTQ